MYSYSQHCRYRCHLGRLVGSRTRASHRPPTPPFSIRQPCGLSQVGALRTARSATTRVCFRATPAPTSSHLVPTLPTLVVVLGGDASLRVLTKYNSSLRICVRVRVLVLLRVHGEAKRVLSAVPVPAPPSPATSHSFLVVACHSPHPSRHRAPIYLSIALRSYLLLYPLLFFLLL
jgi:hypothetical protein